MTPRDGVPDSLYPHKYNEPQTPSRGVIDSMELMHNSIYQSWNRKVTNGDTVYILGDVSMRGKSEKLIAYVATLKGKKVLIKGNHDDLSDYRYQQLFDEICDYKEITDSVDGKTYDLVLCHYPILSWNKMNRGSILLYGHTHNSPEDDFFQECLQEMCEKDERHIYKEGLRAINVGCMKPWMGYEPRALGELLESYK